MATFSPMRKTRRYVQITLSREEVLRTSDAWLLFAKVEKILRARGVQMESLVYRWHTETPCGWTTTYEVVERLTFEVRGADDIAQDACAHRYDFGSDDQADYERENRDY